MCHTCEPTAPGRTFGSDERLAAVSLAGCLVVFGTSESDTRSQDGTVFSSSRSTCKLKFKTSIVRKIESWYKGIQ